MTVVRNEFESGENNPQRVLYGRDAGVAPSDWHNYGNMTIGARSDIENVTIERLQAFYRTYYQPDNAVLIVAGKFDPDATLALIAKYFGAIPKPARALPRDLHRGTGAGRRAHGDAPPRRQRHSSSACCTTRRAARIRTTSPLDALGEIMTIAPAGRLYQALVETKKATSVRVVELATCTTRATIIFFAQVGAGDPIDAAKDMLLNDVVLDVAKQADHRGRRIACVRGQAETVRRDDQRSAARSASRSPSRSRMGDWRLFFLQPRPLAHAHAGRRASVSRSTYLKPANLTLGASFPTPSPTARPQPAGRRRRGAGQGLQG